MHIATNGGGDNPSEEQAQGGGVTAAESNAGFAIREFSVGVDKLVQLETLAGKNSTVSKYVTLGYKSRSGGYVPIYSQQQLAEADAWVSAPTRPIIRPAAMYIRVESPALNDVILLVFTLRELEGEIKP